ncbi:Multidrug resistance protein EbrA [Frondihabitans sp. 762G35]|nr:Multidrug resistance protein EbrA [Frondihabitans sp. 762G35]
MRSESGTARRSASDRAGRSAFTRVGYGVADSAPPVEQTAGGVGARHGEIVIGYLFLALAIVGEVVATSFLKVASGPSAPWWPYIVVVVGYVFAFAMLAQTLGHGVPLGIAYAIWAGVGVVLVAVISRLVFHETLSLVQLGGIVLVIGGVTMLELGGGHRVES